MPNVKTHTPDSFLGLVNAVMAPPQLPINSDTAVLSAPLSMVGGNNTQITLSGSGGYTEGYDDVYVGRTVLQYDRLDLGVLFKGIGFSIDLGQNGTYPTLHDTLDLFSEAYGIRFHPEDIVNVDLSDVHTTTNIPFAATKTSLNFTGVAQLQAIRPPVELDGLKTELDVFVEPDTPSDLPYHQLESGVGVMFPVNGSRLTLNYDFTKYKNQLSAIATAGLTSNSRAMFPRILLAEFGLSTNLFNHTGLELVIEQPSAGRSRLVITMAGKRDKLYFEYGV
jgi:hypothetical protein